MATAAYTAPGMTIATVGAAVSRATGLATTQDSTDLAKIDQAITAAGQAACTWEGRGWWWSKAFGWFKTAAPSIVTTADSGASRSSNVVTITTTAVHGLAVGQTVVISGVADSDFDGTYTVASVPTTTTFTYAQTGDDATSEEGTVYIATYPLRTINSSAMQDMWAPTGIWTDDDFPLTPIRYEDFLENVVLYGSSTGRPMHHAISGDLYLCLWPLPSTAYTLSLSYIKRHSKINSDETDGSTDAALIVPAEYQWGVYVNGATWLIKHETVDPSALYECPAFVKTMERMAASDPLNYSIPSSMAFPADTRVFINASNLSID